MPLSTEDVVKLLKKAGYELDRETRHVVMRHPTTGISVPIPANRKEVAIGTLKNIERIAGVKLK